MWLNHLVTFPLMGPHGGWESDLMMECRAEICIQVASDIYSNYTGPCQPTQSSNYFSSTNNIYTLTPLSTMFNPINLLLQPNKNNIHPLTQQQHPRILNVIKHPRQQPSTRSEYRRPVDGDDD